MKKLGACLGANLPATAVTIFSGSADRLKPGLQRRFRTFLLESRLEAESGPGERTG